MCQSFFRIDKPKTESCCKFESYRPNHSNLNQGHIQSHADIQLTRPNRRTNIYWNLFTPFSGVALNNISMGWGLRDFPTARNENFSTAAPVAKLREKFLRHFRRNDIFWPNCVWNWIAIVNNSLPKMYIGGYWMHFIYALKEKRFCQSWVRVCKAITEKLSPSCQLFPLKVLFTLIKILQFPQLDWMPPVPGIHYLFNFQQCLVDLNHFSAFSHLLQ